MLDEHLINCLDFIELFTNLQRYKITWFGMKPVHNPLTIRVELNIWEKWRRKRSMEKKNKVGVIIVALLLATLMASMDNTILATAMGTIVGDLGGFDKLMWVTSAYMIAEMAGMPIFGKLSDMYGRKRFFIFGIIVFMIGSALCGTANSIVQLSIYRAIQGIGGGALVPIAFTIMFDVVAPEKRGKSVGYSVLPMVFPVFLVLLLALI